MTATPKSPFRGLGRALAPLWATLLVVLLATPAAADVPEGWSDPDPVDGVHAVLVLGGASVGLFALIWFLVWLPGMIRGNKSAEE